jgi:hypothetical protein
MERNADIALTLLYVALVFYLSIIAWYSYQS